MKFLLSTILITNVVLATALENSGPLDNINQGPLIGVIDSTDDGQAIDSVGLPVPSLHEKQGRIQKRTLSLIMQLLESCMGMFGLSSGGSYTTSGGSDTSGSGNVQVSGGSDTSGSSNNQVSGGSGVNVNTGSSSLNSIIQQVSPQISSIISQVAPSLSSISTQLGPQISQIISSFLSGSGQMDLSSLTPEIETIISQISPQIISIVSSVAPQVAGVATVVIPQIASQLPEIMSQVSPQVQSQIPAIMSKVTQYAPGIVNIVSQYAPEAAQPVSHIISVVGQAASEAQTNLAGAISNVVPQVISQVTQVAPVLPQVVSQIPNIVSKQLPAIATDLPQVASAFAQIAPAATSVPDAPSLLDQSAAPSPDIAETSPTFITQAPTVSKAVASEVSNVLGSVPGPVSSAISGIVSLVNEFAPQYAAVIPQFFGQIAPGGNVNIQLIEQTVEEYFPSYSTIVKTYLDQLAPNGTLTIQDLLTTISNNFPALSQLIQAILNLFVSNGGTITVSQMTSLVSQYMPKLSGFVNDVISQAGLSETTIVTIQTIITMVTRYLPQLATVVQQIAPGVASAATAMPAIVSQVALATGTDSANMQNIVSVITQYLPQYASVITKYIPAGSSEWTQIFKIVRQYAPQFMTLASQLVSQLAPSAGATMFYTQWGTTVTQAGRTTFRYTQQAAGLGLATAAALPGSSVTAAANPVNTGSFSRDEPTDSDLAFVSSLVAPVQPSASEDVVAMFKRNPEMLVKSSKSVPVSTVYVTSNGSLASTPYSVISETNIPLHTASSIGVSSGIREMVTESSAYVATVSEYVTSPADVILTSHTNATTTDIASLGSSRTIVKPITIVSNGSLVPILTTISLPDSLSQAAASTPTANASIDIAVAVSTLAAATDSAVNATLSASKIMSYVGPAATTTMGVSASNLGPVLVAPYTIGQVVNPTIDFEVTLFVTECCKAVCARQTTVTVPVIPVITVAETDCKDECQTVTQACPYCTFSTTVVTTSAVVTSADGSASTVTVYSPSACVAKPATTPALVRTQKTGTITLSGTAIAVTTAPYVALANPYEHITTTFTYMEECGGPCVSATHPPNISAVLPASSTGEFLNSTVKIPAITKPHGTVSCASGKCVTTGPAPVVCVSTECNTVAYPTVNCSDKRCATIPIPNVIPTLTGTNAIPETAVAYTKLTTMVHDTALCSNGNCITSGPAPVVCLSSECTTVAYPTVACSKGECSTGSISQGTFSVTPSGAPSVTHTGLTTLFHGAVSCASGQCDTTGPAPICLSSECTTIAYPTVACVGSECTTALLPKVTPKTEQSADSNIAMTTKSYGSVICSEASCRTMGPAPVICVEAWCTTVAYPTVSCSKGECTTAAVVPGISFTPTFSKGGTTPDLCTKDQCVSQVSATAVAFSPETGSAAKLSAGVCLIVAMLACLAA